MYMLFHGARLCFSYIYSYMYIQTFVCLGHDAFLIIGRSQKKLGKKLTNVNTFHYTDNFSHFHPEQIGFLMSLEV